MKRDKRAGKSKKEVEVEAARRDAEAAEDEVEAEAKKKPETPVKFLMGHEYDEQRKALR